MSSDFTAPAVELYEHEEKEEQKKITSAKHRCNAFPSSPVIQSISPSLLLIETGRVCKSLMFLRNHADDSVSVLPQATTLNTYRSWENSCLILQSSMVNRKNIDLHASLAEHQRREKLYYLYVLMFYQGKCIAGNSLTTSTNTN